jgi:TPP-dependent pyruvate/acetoin dehydrogenase alpha subunit
MTAVASAGSGLKPMELLRTMLRIRMVEEAIAGHYSSGEMRCPTHLSIGQEAVAAGVCAALERTDYAISTHRGHAHYLAKGGSLDAMIAELHGRASGCCSGWGGSMHLIDQSAGLIGTTPIVGGSLPLAVGTAFGSALLGEDRVSVVFFGDGTTEEGVFAESLNFAALHALPVIFVCENNHFSVYSGLEVRQAPGRDRLLLAQSQGLATGTADGNDALAVCEATQAAVARARRGDGPTYLEFETYRWREHCGPNYDNDLGYRDEAEFQAWRRRCPVATLEARLCIGDAAASADLDAFRAACSDEIEAAFERALQAPYLDPASLTEASMYSEPAS